MSTDEGYTIICVGHEWDKFQRRYRSLMSRLVNYKKIDSVVYVESPRTFFSFIKFLLKRTTQYDSEIWQRIIKKGIIYQIEEVWIITPFAILPYTVFLGPLGAINLAIMRLLRRILIKYILNRLGARNIILWISHPYFTDDLIGRFKEILLCYDLCDDYTLFYEPSSRIGEKIRKIDNIISCKADLIFVTTENLLEKKRKINQNTYRIPNGVDFDYFQKRLLDKSVLDKKFLSAKRPILSYVGRVTKNTDVVLIERLADAYPEWTVAFIGPADKKDNRIKRLLQKENILILGEKPYADVPPYLAHSDLCINPIIVNSTTNSMDTMKLYSYLASGKPVVSLAVNRAKELNSVIHVAENHEDFILKVKDAIERSNASSKEKQLSIAKENTWNSRVKDIYSVIDEKISQKQNNQYFKYPDWKIKLRSGDRLIPEERSKSGVFIEEHYARYEFAAKFVEGKKVLDAGCGTGYGSALLVQSGALYVRGVDISPEAIDYAKALYSRIPRLEFEVGNLVNPDVYSENDMIVCFETIEHVPLKIAERLIDNAYRSLRPGGIFIVSSPNRSARFPDARLIDSLNVPHHEFEFDLDEFSQALKQRFNNVKIFGQRNMSPDQNKILLKDLQEGYVNKDKKKPNKLKEFLKVMMLNIPFLDKWLLKYMDYKERFQIREIEKISPKISEIPNGNIPLNLCALCEK